VLSILKFFDCLGRELESRVWLGPDFSTGKVANRFHKMMRDYEKDGITYWVCNDCHLDIKNRSEGKDV